MGLFLLLVGGLLLAVLFLPVPVLVKLAFKSKLHITLRLFGVLPLPARWPRREKGAPEALRAKSDAGGEGFHLLKRLMEYDLSPANVKPVFRFLNSAFQSVRIRLRTGELVVGAGEPHQTAVWIGRIHAFTYGAGQGARIRITGDFTRERLEGAVEGWVFLYPGRTAAALIRLAWAMR